MGKNIEKNPKFDPVRAFGKKRPRNAKNMMYRVLVLRSRGSGNLALLLRVGASSMNYRFEIIEEMHCSNTFNKL